MKEKTTILIADDNQEFAQTLAKYIHEQDDMEVIGIAKDGEEAIDMITNIMPDVALLDVIMPHLDGIGVLEKLNIIKCILKNPKLILIDSIFSFLNKHEKLKIFSMIKKYQLELNLTIIYTTVNLEDVLFSDSVYIINNKKISLISMEDLFTSKIIKDNHINIPVFYELKDKLKLYNLISDNVSIIDEMVDEICR